MLAEMLDRPLRVEACENRFEIFFWNPWPLVIDRNDEGSAARLASEFDGDS